ncbi:hypothetical protein AJ79_04715 [Helicocarpus griseus UAMH5409]|uniref:Diphthine methyltransferase n=1 Tax=Helicocarpus griseus UAMH5409 TaxID=1447875 RepID=A0A2B7XST3_9EURO|nr:hypothetical protein AJ79_04715 [Helicocarpus griseus UAMH5409]
MTAIQTPQSLDTIFLDQPPSCLEFCPEAPDYFVIGTYLLSESSSNDSSGPQQTKTGSIQLFILDPESYQLTQIHKTPLPQAVFDLHFSPRDPTLLAIATSAASVSLYRLETCSSASTPTGLTHQTTIPVHEDPSIPALFLSWLPPPPGSHDIEHAKPCTDIDGFAVSFSDGQVSIFHTNPPSHSFSKESLTEIALPGEPIEVWYTAFHLRQNGSLAGKGYPMLFSGDDFGSLRVHEFAGDGDDEDQGEGESPQSPAQTRAVSDRGRNHGAGVTAILPLFTSDSWETILLTGSYDEYLRVYGYAGRGQVLAEERLGGGVWRLKVIDEEGPDVKTGQRSYLVLASCMHAGTRIVKVTYSAAGEGEGKWEIEVLAQFTEHESMNYASDVRKGRGGGEVDGGPSRQNEEDSFPLLCVSSSFYDKRVCVWKVKV